MRIKKWIGMGLCGLIAGTGVSFAQSDMMAEIDEAFKTGTLKGSLGAMYLEQAPSGQDNQMLGTGFIELEYITGEMRGLQLGVDVLGVGELYTHNEDFNNFYDDDVALRELYLKYNMENSSAVIGRHTPMVPPVIEGDSFEGLTLNIGEWEDRGVKVVASVFNRGVRSVAWNEEGITDWTDVDANGGEDFLWSVMAEFDVMENMVTLKPYIVHQGDFATVYGAQASMTQEMEGAQLAATMDYYFVAEDADPAIYGANLDDSDAWKLYLSGKMEAASAGVGYYGYSDENNQLVAGDGWLNDLEALDDTFAYLNNAYFTGQDSDTYWLDLGYDWEGLKLAAQLGSYEDDANMEFDQLMLKAGYDVSQSFEVAAKYVNVDGKQNMNDTDIYKIYGVYKF